VASCTLGRLLPKESDPVKHCREAGRAAGPVCGRWRSGISGNDRRLSGGQSVAVQPAAFLAVTKNVVGFWDMTTYTLIEVHRSFWLSCCLHSFDDTASHSGRWRSL